MLFSKKWLKYHPKFLLHFQIHIDVLMLCRKFELIPSSNFSQTFYVTSEHVYASENVIKMKNSLLAIFDEMTYFFQCI